MCLIYKCYSEIASFLAMTNLKGTGDKHDGIDFRNNVKTLALDKGRGGYVPDLLLEDFSYY